MGFGRIGYQINIFDKYDLPVDINDRWRVVEERIPFPLHGSSMTFTYKKIDTPLI